MAFYSVFTLIFLTLTVTTATAATTTAASDATTASFDLENLVSAIISAGNFQEWATLVSTNPHFLPPNSTLFIPVITTATKNTTVSPPFINRHPFSTASYNEDFVFHHHDNHHHRKIPPLIQSYVLLLHHTVPHRLSFSDLIQFPATTRLPNLLPNFTLLITTESRSVSCNLSIQGSCVTQLEGSTEISFKFDSWPYCETTIRSWITTCLSAASAVLLFISFVQGPGLLGEVCCILSVNGLLAQLTRNPYLLPSNLPLARQIPQQTAQVEGRTDIGNPPLIPGESSAQVIIAVEQRLELQEQVVVIVDVIAGEQQQITRTNVGAIRLRNDTSWAWLAQEVHGVYERRGGQLQAVQAPLNPYNCWPGRSISYVGFGRGYVFWPENSWDYAYGNIRVIVLRGGWA